MIAVKRLQSLFWVLLVALGALGAYMVSLRVATERNELRQVHAQIVRTRGDIRYLELEFQARANMRQLEKWNAEVFRYSALAAEHYLDGERALAQLDGIGPDDSNYAPPPVMVAMMEAEAGSDSASATAAGDMTTGDVVTRPGRDDSPQRDIDDADTSPAKGNRNAADEGSARLADAGDTGKATANIMGKAERVALLDARLLDESTLSEIGRRAASEKGGERR